MRLAPGTSSLKPVSKNTTIFICYGTRDGMNAEQRAASKERGALWLSMHDNPLEYTWPVSGCGVILLDCAPMDESRAQLLGLAIKRDGGEALNWTNFSTNNTSYVTGGNND